MRTLALSLTNGSAFTRSLSALTALALFLPLGGIFTVVETAHADYTQCADGIDNDRDGRTDYPEDDNCSSIDDTTEWADNGVFVSVTDNRDTVSPGEAVIYIITLKQQRDDVALMDVMFHIPFQSGITYLSDDGSIINGGATGRWIKVAVFKNNTRRLSVHAVISPYAKPEQLLVTRVTANGSTASDTTLVSTAGRAIPYPENQLQVSISDHRDNAGPGDVLDYLVTVRNPERTGTTVHVRVKIPVALQVTDARDADFIGNEIVWQNVTLDPGQEKTFSFRAVVDTRAPRSYAIQVVARAGNVVAYDRTVTGGSPYNLFATITDNRDTANRGDLLTYAIHIDNTAGRLDPDANINASLPIHGEFVSATEGGTWDGRNVRWMHIQVAPGGSRDLMFTVRVRSDAPDATLLRATALVQGFTTSDITQVTGGAAGLYGHPADDTSAYDDNVLFVRKTVIGNDDSSYIQTTMSNVDVYDQLMPVTGIGDFFSPLEDTGKFLTPIASAAEGNGLPLVVWMAVMAIGMATGGVMGKKYLA